MKRFFTALLFFIAIGVSAQSGGTITGTILDANGNPLPGINIAIDPLSLRTATDAEGQYHIAQVPSGNHTLTVSGVGYTLQKKDIRVDGRRLELDLVLDVANRTLTEVVVSGTRGRPVLSSAVTRDATALRDIPQSIQVVDQATIQEQQLFTIDQALKNVAGVNLSASYGAVNMRGFNTNAGAFLTNGIKGSPYPEGVMPLLGNVERVEVIHGASAILYGEGSVGGNINLVTKQPKPQTTANVSLGAGNQSLFRGLADVTGSINKQQTVYFLLGTAYQHGGRFTQHFDNDNLQVYGSLKWDASARTSFQLNANYSRDRSTGTWLPGIPVLPGLDLFSLPTDFTYYGSDGRYEGDSYQFQGIVKHRLSPTWDAQLLVGVSQSRADRREYRLSWDYDPATTELGRTYASQQLNSPTTTINPFVTGTVSTFGVANRITAGADISYNRSNYPRGIRSYAADPFLINAPDYDPAAAGTANSWSSAWEKFTYNTAAAYVQDHITITDQFKALLGLRYTNYFMRYRAVNDAGEVTNDERPEVTESITPRAGLVYQPWASTSIYIDYNRGFIPQYSNERKYGGPFDPETSHQFELGYKGSYLHNRLHPSIAVYQITKRNVLKYYQDEALPNGFGYRPLEQVRSRGIELGLSGSITDELYLIANYSHNETIINKSDDPAEIGAGFYNAPSDVASAWLSYTLRKTALKGLFAGVGFNYVGDRTAYFGEAPGYTLLDAAIGYRYAQFTLQCNGNNLADRNYVYAGGYADYTPGSPRNFMVTLSYSLK
ncbi:TonB-dependent receptor [Parapedobacter koreensis]|uniref:Iron complex outermembrane recepter protein n=1 Tax=Parapedobacter koreensis TaxID=332977 RepID=A0A1H7Q2F9_9SPHI|nr:TonB-dependent receptor [Parapedobacter koreensis]SEL42192.1 iron complex outermembrane recepter protein [Parapedobacter koreensis]